MTPGGALARALVLACLATASGAARADTQACPDEDRRAGAVAADEAYEHYQAGRYEAALARFSKAESLCHSARVVAFMARARERLGQLLLARMLFERVADEARRDPALGDLALEVRRELTQLRPRIPTLAVSVKGGSSDDVTVTVDGRKLAATDFGRPRELDPGKHHIVALRGEESAEQHVVVKEHDAQRVALAFATRERPDEPEPARSSRTKETALLVTSGVTAAALGLGIVTGIVSANRVSDIKDRCLGNACLKSDADEASTARTLGNISTIGFVVAGLGALGAMVIVVMPIDKEPKAGSARVLPTGAVFGGAF